MNFKLVSLVLAVAVASLFVVAPTASVKADGCDGYIVVGVTKTTMCVKKLIKSAYRSYYTVGLPTLTLGDLPGTVGVRDRGVMNLAQIEKQANLFWGALAFPLPY